MAQARYKDCLKLANGFSLVAKAFTDLQSSELKQVWNNSSVKAAVQEIGLQVEDKFSDCMVTGSVSLSPFQFDKQMYIEVHVGSL